MRFFAYLLPAALGLCLVGCGGSSDSDPNDVNVRTVKLPGGKEIRSEVVYRPEDMQRGMMFRESLAPDRGMLFLHAAPGLYPYWMYQCKISLDIIWMDSDHRITEISADTPPCRTEASQCPNYGGHVVSQYVLELAGGMAAKYGLKTGDRLEF